MAKILLNLQDMHTTGYHGVHMLHQYRKHTAEPMEDIFYDEVELHKESSYGDEMPLVYVASIAGVHKPSMQVIENKLAIIKQQLENERTFASSWSNGHTLVILELTSDLSFVDKINKTIDGNGEMDTYLLLEVIGDQITEYSVVE